MSDDPITAYDQAWNASDPAARTRLLERALTLDAEFVDPVAGRIRGLDAISQRIAGFADRFPGARVTITSGVDEHNGFARYAWTIADGDTTILEGIDIIERANDRRIKRIIMFFGQLPPTA